MIPESKFTVHRLLGVIQYILCMIEPLVFDSEYFCKAVANLKSCVDQLYVSSDDVPF